MGSVFGAHCDLVLLQLRAFCVYACRVNGKIIIKRSIAIAIAIAFAFAFAIAQIIVLLRGNKQNTD